MTQLDLMPIRPRCPECGIGTIELVTDGQVGEFYIKGGFQNANDPLPMRLKNVPFGACNRCEFCIEIDPRELRGSKPERRIA